MHYLWIVTTFGEEHSETFYQSYTRLSYLYRIVNEQNIRTSTFANSENALATFVKVVQDCSAGEYFECHLFDENAPRFNAICVLLF